MDYLEAINLTDAGYEAAQEAKLLDTFMKDSEELLMLASEYEGLINYLSDPWIDTKEKEGLFIQMKFDRLFINWMLVIIDNKAFNKIEYILTKFRKKYNVLNGLTEGIIFSTQKIQKEKIEEFEEKLSIKLKKKIKLKNVMDKTLIAGAKITIDDYVIDNSVEQRTIDLVKAMRNK